MGSAEFGQDASPVEPVLVSGLVSMGVGSQASRQAFANRRGPVAPTGLDLGGEKLKYSTACLRCQNSHKPRAP